MNNDAIKSFLNELNQVYHANLLILNDALETIAMVYADNNSQVHSFFCFNYNEAVCKRCSDFAKHCIMSVLTNPDTYLHEKCWAGFRLSAKRISVGDLHYYAVIDAYLLDSDKDFEDISLEGTGLMHSEIEAKRHQINVFTAEQIEHYFTQVEIFFRSNLT